MYYYIRQLRGVSLKCKLRSSRRLFGELCQAAAALHNVFNFPVLCIIICKLIGLVFTLFLLIYRFMNPQDQFASVMQTSILVAFIRDFLTLLTVCHAADMPVVQVMCTKIFQIIFTVLIWGIDLIIGCRASRENHWNHN